MNNWKLIKFLDVLEEPVRNGIYKSKEFHGIGTKIVNMGELFSNGRLYDIDMRRIYLTDKEKDKYILKNGDLIFARRSLTADGAGKCSLIYKITEDVVFESSIIRARPNLNKVDSLFLFYFFNSPYGKYLIGTILRQVAVAGITGSDLMRLEFLLPPLPEQKAIAGVLGSLDDKIDLLQRQNTTLEAMAETLFRQWFIEEAQEDWEEKTLGEFFPIKTGKKDANFSSIDGEYPFFTCSKQASKASNYSFEGSAILLAGNGDFNVKRYIGKFEAYQRTYVLMPYETKFFNFLFVLVKYFLQDITGGYRGSVINFITKGMISNFKISLPKNDFSLKLEKFDMIFYKIDYNQQQIRTLEKLRDTLLPKLMSGEVRVRMDG